MTDDQLNNGSEHVSAKSLWSDQEKTRQFLLPDTRQIPPGDFVLHTRSGQEMRVNEEAVLHFEVSDDEAKAWLKAQLKDVMRQLGSGLRNSLFGASQEHKEKDKSNDKVTPEEEKQSSTTPGLDLLADIIGTARESMNGNYGAIGHALRDYLSDIASTVGDSVSGEPQRKASAWMGGKRRCVSMGLRLLIRKTKGRRLQILLAKLMNLRERSRGRCCSKRGR